MAPGIAVLRVLLVHAFGDVPNGHEGCKFFTFPRGVRGIASGEREWRRRGESWDSANTALDRGESFLIRVLVVQTKWANLVGEKMSICLLLKMVFEINFPVTM